MKQSEEIIKYIKKYGSITRKTAFDDIGIAELPARICELKAKGYRFKEKREGFITRLGKKSSYIRYSLED